MQKTCVGCGVEFEAPRARTKYHNQDCANRHIAGARKGVVTARAARPQAGDSLDRDVEVRSLRDAVTRYRNAYESVVRDHASEERLTAMFRASIAAFPRVPRGAFTRPMAKAKQSPLSVEVPMLLLGDQHIGEVISFDQTHGINTYNFAVFQQRLEHLEDRVLDLLTEHQRANFPELVIAGLGDNISGRIHVELEKHGAQHVVDQVYVGALATALFLRRLSTQLRARLRGRFGRHGAFRGVRYIGVSGNHGRLDDKKESKSYYKNFDYLFNSIIATALAGHEDVAIEIPKAIFTVADVAGQRILISHGMELPPSSLGIPLYSINRASAAYQEMLSIAKEERYDYWVLGHFHRPMELDNAIVNGTVAGLSEFGIGKFKPIRPMQKLTGFHSKWGKAWEYPIRLDMAPTHTQVYTFDQDMNATDALAHFRNAA